MRLLLLLIILNMPLTILANQNSDTDTTKTGKRIYTTKKLVSSPPKIDGLLTDDCWNEGYWTSDFKQFIPREGDPASQKTEMKILYDNKNVYVAFRVYETDPNNIDLQRSRRDNYGGDVVGVAFDSYLDYRTGFGFYITAAGTKIDLLLLNTGDDLSWDAVWYGKTGLADFGWTAEMQIPLSQLRYGNEKKQVWGLHAWRWMNQIQEATHWNLIPRDHNGPLYFIGELHGIENIPQSRRIEFLPYSVGKMKTYEKEEGNPYSTGRNSNISFGLDGKIGISSDFTVDYTINPDFGQVEADPAELNLTAYETFYEEKRPFFLEGKNIMDFGGEQLFYSRRIGQRPGRSPDLEENEYAEELENTSIISALKLTGKTKKGLSIGIIESLTAKESVEISSGDDTRNEIVEPMTNYFVSRVQKDYNKGNTIIGGMLTSTNRSLSKSYLNEFNKSAITGGIDFKHHWKDKIYFVDINTEFSYVNGSEEAITNLQRSSSRYFYRPDADYLSLDTTATYLSGHGGEIEFGKDRKGHWRFYVEFNWRSPGLELNDIGFLNTADEIEQEIEIGYVENEPKGIFRNYNIWLSQGNYWNFGGDFLSSYANISFNSTFINKWSFGGHFLWNGNVTDMRVLRGGPAIKMKGFLCQYYYVNSDQSKKFYYGLNYHFHIYNDKLSNIQDISSYITWKISDAFQLSTDIFYSYSKDNFKYVSKFEVDDDPRYLLATLSRKTLGMTMRLDYTITPDLTIQYYANPYISVGIYDNFKNITNPKANNYNDLYHIYSDDEKPYDENNQSYTIVDLDNDVNLYTFDNPDFRYNQLQSNLVVRWEYKPGSTLYLVWTHGRSSHEINSDFSVIDGINNFFNNTAENVFLIKFNYWFTL